MDDFVTERYFENVGALTRFYWIADLLGQRPYLYQPHTNPEFEYKISRDFADLIRKSHNEGESLKDFASRITATPFAELPSGKTTPVVKSTPEPIPAEEDELIRIGEILSSKGHKAAFIRWFFRFTPHLEDKVWTKNDRGWYLSSREHMSKLVKFFENNENPYTLASDNAIYKQLEIDLIGKSTGKSMTAHEYHRKREKLRKEKERRYLESKRQRELENDEKKSATLSIKQEAPQTTIGQQDSVILNEIYIVARQIRNKVTGLEGFAKFVMTASLVLEVVLILLLIFTLIK